AYGYSYDAANRLLKADFRESPGTAHTWAENPATKFNVKMGDGVTPTSAYDANGNILQMQQEGKTGPTTSGLIDNLYYNYTKNSATTGNRLQGVYDAQNNPSSTLGDFKEITTGSAGDLDYDQDPNGNLTRDNNKGISAITYNHLNLPELVTITGKGSIRYVYDAAGVKHRKTVTDQTGPQSKTTVTAYSGGLVYENDSLRLISHEEGRIRVNSEVQPVEYTYDYFIKDHLGNVRMVLTEGSQQQLYLASMETERSATENALFSNIESSRSAKPAGYPQDASAGNQNSQVAKLNGQHPDKRVGPSLVLKVMAGDTISIGAKAFYKSIGRKQDKSLVPVADMATSLLRAFGGGQPGGGDKETAGENMARSPLNEQFLNDGYERMKQKEPADPAQANRPKAYLNFALFDDAFNLVEENSGVRQVKAEPDQLQTLAQDKMVIKKGGFLYVYTSNETPQDVFFDNLVVMNSPGAVLEETHYYPFGLTMAGISTKAPGKLENKYKFTGQLLDDDLGWNTYQMKWRTMDPQIGRFLQVDPLASSYVHNSTYAYAENKVTTGIDLEGLEWVSKIDGSGATNVSVNVNFSVDKNLKLSPEQIAAYQSAISSQLNSTMQLSSDGTMSGSVTYNGGDSKALGVVVPSLSLYGDASIVGGQTIFSASSVNIFDKKGNLRSPEMVANDAVHELLHTVRFEHPFEKTQGADTKLVSEGGNNYSTTPATDSKIPFNIMNYPMINIDGKKSGDLWKSTGQSPSYLTKDQIKMLLNEIKLQNNGAGVPGSSGYLNYWINTPGEEVKKKQNE
ncbi:RHS repeat-associated core domain-containing protein, partial [Chitinophaga alhagiae]|uniref:RHS repeat-associated core domain-containing protein n=1 Tax=Chitinophaga alhagiae TaxID=2203219 RepID=UPI0018E5476A